MFYVKIFTTKSMSIRRCCLCTCFGAKEHLPCETNRFLFFKFIAVCFIFKETETTCSSQKATYFVQKFLPFDMRMRQNKLFSCLLIHFIISYIQTSLFIVIVSMKIQVRMGHQKPIGNCACCKRRLM